MSTCIVFVSLDETDIIEYAIFHVVRNSMGARFMKLCTLINIVQFILAKNIINSQMSSENVHHENAGNRT